MIEKIKEQVNWCVVFIFKMKKKEKKKCHLKQKHDSVFFLFCYSNPNLVYALSLHFIVSILLPNHEISLGDGFSWKKIPLKTVQRFKFWFSHHVCLLAEHVLYIKLILIRKWNENRIYRYTYLCIKKQMHLKFKNIIGWKCQKTVTIWNSEIDFQQLKCYAKKNHPNKQGFSSISDWMRWNINFL